MPVSAQRTTHSATLVCSFVPFNISFEKREIGLESYFWHARFEMRRHRLTKKQRYCFRCNFFTSKARRAAFFGFFRGQLYSFHLAQCAHHTSSMLLPASSPLPWLASHLLWVGFSWTSVHSCNGTGWGPLVVRQA